MLDLWHKNAVIYYLDVETYMDGNGDGIGDFIGLTQRMVLGQVVRFHVRKDLYRPELGLVNTVAINLD